MTCSYRDGRNFGNLISYKENETITMWAACCISLSEIKFRFSTVDLVSVWLYTLQVDSNQKIRLIWSDATHSIFRLRSVEFVLLNHLFHNATIASAFFFFSKTKKSKEFDDLLAPWALIFWCSFLRQKSQLLSVHHVLYNLLLTKIICFLTPQTIA